MTLVLSAVACEPPDLPAPGIPAELAAFRSRTISEIRYHLSLRIPEAVEQPVAGTVTIDFLLRDPSRALVLDFFTSPENIRSVTDANGTPLPHTVVHDHIVIPASALRSGAQRMQVAFLAGDGALNRNPDFLYTLFVPDRASTAFPCFDQPDLKGRLRLTLDVPSSWTAVANAPLERADTTAEGVRLVFRETAPLSTYLFAFVAGKFHAEERQRDGRVLRMYHREDNLRTIRRNLDEVFDLHARALRWLEEYTGIPYPFEKFDFVAIPSFQFGGMEHPGAVLYRSSSLFLEESASQNQLLGRASLIAHETAHMWFGDLVTMRWFDDVWMKEVFANFMAAKIVEPSFPEINHELRFFLAHHPRAYAVDRTAGTNPIRQELGNLREAGTLYGAIIYQKAPIVMRHLERTIGEEAMRDGLREYLARFQFANASWTDLITILDGLTSEDLASWSHVWVEEPGRPTITASVTREDTARAVLVEQRDPWERGRVWNQWIQIAFGIPDAVATIPVQLRASEARVPIRSPGRAASFLLAGADGLGYGRFLLDTRSRQFLVEHLPSLENPLHRAAAWVALWEHVLDGDVAAETFIVQTLQSLTAEPDELIVEYVTGLLETAYWRFVRSSTRGELASRVEAALWSALDRSVTQTRKGALFEAIVSMTLTDEGTNRLISIWRGDEAVAGLPLEERQLTRLAEALALRGVSNADSILDVQASRIGNPDRRARFAFVRPSLAEGPAVRDSVFRSFANPANREREPWVLDAVGYLHHPLRADHAIRYVRPSLELTEEIQRTGDIFFPLRWLEAMLDGHQSAEAAEIVVGFLAERPDYPRQLRGKVLQAADDLFRAARIVNNWSGTTPS